MGEKKQTTVLKHLNNNVPKIMAMPHRPNMNAATNFYHRTVDTAFIDNVRHALNWLATNLAPLIALVMLLSLAVIGSEQVLGNTLRHNQRLILSIIIVGSFASLALSSRKSPLKT